MESFGNPVRPGTASQDNVMKYVQCSIYVSEEIDHIEIWL